MSEEPLDMPSGEELPLSAGARVLCRAAGLVALYKPEGLRAHPNESGRVDKGALLAAPYDLKRECYLLQDGRQVHLLHRLDGPTSGLLIVCTDASLAEIVRGLFARHMVKKRYEALVFGNAGKGRQQWRDRLRTEKGGAGARTSAGAGDIATAAMSVIASGTVRNGLPVSHIALEPGTGRTHQLRVQCATRQLPIIGDATYGNFAWNKRAAKELGLKRLCLHSASITLEYERAGKMSQFTAKCPAPDEFSALFKIS
ncbi:MAG: RNA pseudouridine synthase [Opitutales bacterium]|nr:RNA pseudouridine synthase [Opitutales bacterium]